MYCLKYETEVRMNIIIVIIVIILITITSIIIIGCSQIENKVKSWYTALSSADEVLYLCTDSLFSREDFHFSDFRLDFLSTARSFAPYETFTILAYRITLGIALYGISSDPFWLIVMNIDSNILWSNAQFLFLRILVIRTTRRRFTKI